MAITAISEIRYGTEEGVKIFLPGDNVEGVPDEVLLEFVEAGSVLLTGKDSPQGQERQAVQEPPITSAADPRYLKQQVEARQQEEKVRQERLSFFKKTGSTEHDLGTDRGLPNTGAVPTQPSAGVTSSPPKPAAGK